MPSRRLLKGIATGIAGSFCSRNNDIDGYWALGIFYKLAAEARNTRFFLDLETGKSIPESRYSKRISEHYLNYLLSQLEKLGMDKSQISSATIEIEFNTQPTKRQVALKETWGDPFVCFVQVFDDRQKAWSAEFRGWCGQHNLRVERRSIRRYVS